MPNHERGVERAINASWVELETFFGSGPWDQSPRDPSAIISAMPWADWTQRMGRVVTPLSQAIGGAFTEEAGLTGIKADLSMDVVDEISHAYAQTQGAKLIASVSEAQRQTVRTMVAESMRGQWTVDDLGKRLQRTVGLHPAWAQAVVNTELRQYNNLIKEGKSEEQARTLAARRANNHRKKLLRRRGDNIARTEIQTASNLGRFASWSESVGKGYASKDSRKEFSPGPGACEHCAPYSGEVVGWDQPFSNGKTMPPFHPSCRCTAVLLPPDYDDEDLDPEEFDWLGDTDVTVRPSFNSGLMNRLSSVIRQPTPIQQMGVEQVATSIAQQATVTRADQYNTQNTAGWSDDDLAALLSEAFETGDFELAMKVEAITEDRERLDAAFRAQQAADDAADAAAAQAAKEELDRRTEAYEGGSILADRDSEVFNPAARKSRGLTKQQRLDEEFMNYIDQSMLKALDSTNGNFWNKKGRAMMREKGLDEYALFTGTASWAKAYASEELIEFWRENGRLGKSAFNFMLNGDDSGRRAMQRAIRDGFAGRMNGGRRDRA